MARAVFLFVLLCLPLGAQQKPSAGAQVRLVAQQVPAKLGNVVMTAGEIRSAPFTLPVNNLSERTAAPARVFAIQPEDQAVPLAKVALPESGDDFIILLVIGENPGFTPVVLPGKDPAFRPGDAYLHNVSKRTIVGMVGSQKFTVAPGKGSIVRPAGAKEGRYYDVAIGVHEPSGTRLISTSRWPVEERVRSYLFFFENPRRRDVDFRAIDEFVPIEEKKAP